MVKKNKKHNVVSKIAIVVGLFLLILLSLFGIKYRDCINSNFMMCVTAEEYKSENISFKYPSFFPLSEFDEEWEIDQSKELGWIDFIDFSPAAYFNGGGDRLGSIEISSISGARNIDELDKELNTVKERKEYSNRSGRIEIFRILPPHTEKVTIGNGIEALKITTKPGINTFGESDASYVFYRNNLMYSITFNYDDYYHKKPESDYINGFDLILNSIKVD